MGNIINTKNKIIGIIVKNNKYSILLRHYYTEK